MDRSCADPVLDMNPLLPDSWSLPTSLYSGCIHPLSRWSVLLPGPLVLTRTSMNLGSDQRTTVPTFSLQTVLSHTISPRCCRNDKCRFSRSYMPSSVLELMEETKKVKGPTSDLVGAHNQLWPQGSVKRSRPVRASWQVPMWLLQSGNTHCAVGL